MDKYRNMDIFSPRYHLDGQIFRLGSSCEWALEIIDPFWTSAFLEIARNVNIILISDLESANRGLLFVIPHD